MIKHDRISRASAASASDAADEAADAAAAPTAAVAAATAAAGSFFDVRRSSISTKLINIKYDFFSPKLAFGNFQRIMVVIYRSRKV